MQLLFTQRTQYSILNFTTQCRFLDALIYEFGDLWDLTILHKALHFHFLRCKTCFSVPKDYVRVQEITLNLITQYEYTRYKLMLPLQSLVQNTHKHKSEHTHNNQTLQNPPCKWFKHP